MKETRRKLLSFPLLLAGFLFLLNPPVNLIDLLPDAVGYLCLFFGVRGAAEYFPYFDELKNGFHKLFWLSLSKLPAFFLFALVYGGNTSERSLITVLALGYFVLELLFLLPVFRTLFRAVSYLGERYGVKAAEGRVKGESDALYTFTTVFLVIRGALSFLPELLFLPVRDGIESSVAAVDFQQYYVVAVALAQILGIVLGIAWYLKLRRYLCGLSADDTLRELLLKTAAETPPAVRLVRDGYTRLYTAFSVAAVGVGLHLNPIFDGINIFPNFLAALAFLLAVWLFLPFASKKAAYPSGAAALLYTASAAVSYALETSFLTQYSAMDLGRVKAADQLHAACEIAAFITAAVGAFTVLALFFLIYRVLTRAVSMAEDIAYKGVRGDALAASHKKRLCLSAAVGILTVLATALNVYIRRFTVRVEANEGVLGTSTVVIQEFGWFWLVPTVLAFLWLGLFIAEATAVLSELKSIYGLEDEA